MKTFITVIESLALMLMAVCCVQCSDTDADAENDTAALDTAEDSEELRTYIIEIPVLVGNGTVEVFPRQNEYEEGQKVTLTANPDAGWTFKRWDGDFEAQTESVVNVTMDRDLSIEAYFTRVFLLNLTTSGQGKVLLTPDKNVYEQGEQVLLEAVPDENWALERWTGDLAGTANPENITMNADKNIQAVFTESP